MKEINEILLKVRWPLRKSASGLTSQEIEHQIGFELPLDYKNYLTKFQGSEHVIGKEFVRLWDSDELIEMNTSYQITEYLPRTFGIGGNGGGEFIAIELNQENVYRIVLSPFIDLDREAHIEIGSSFTDFLNRLDNGIEWFK